MILKPPPPPQVRMAEQASLWSAVWAARVAEGRRAARVLDAGRRKRAPPQQRHAAHKRTRPAHGEHSNRHTTHCQGLATAQLTVLPITNC